MLPLVPSHHDAIVVLGCRVPQEAEGALRRRADTAARAFHDTGAECVIASGGRRWQGVPEASALRDLLVARGVPAARVVRELWSLSTIENACYTTELLRAASLHRIALVTCDWHMHRALACFVACGVEPAPFASESPPEAPFARRARALAEDVRTWVARTSLPLWLEP
jgi:uncharacterized SAM-binding protein YcdF (DUF218 family)